MHCNAKSAIECPYNNFSFQLTLLYSTFTFLLACDIMTSACERVKDFKDQQSAIFFSPHLISLFSSFFPFSYFFFDLRHSIRTERLQCLVVWEIFQERRAEHHDPFSVLLFPRLLQREFSNAMRKEKFLSSLYATESARLKFLPTSECLLVGALAHLRFLKLFSSFFLVFLVNFFGLSCLF